LWLVLSQTRFGLRTYALGASVEATARAGINVRRHTLALYALMGLLAGVVGVMDVSRFASASIAAHTQDNLAAIAAVVIGGTSLFGGKGRMGGTIIGAFIPAVLRNGFILMGVQPYWQNVAVGAVLILAVYVDQVRRRRARLV
jgi:ribose transport system permease protein